MNIILSGYRDGGSISIKLETRGDHFVIDRRFNVEPRNIGRFNVEPRNIVWRGYPDANNSRLASELEIGLIYILLKNYGCDPHGKEYHYSKTMEILEGILDASNLLAIVDTVPFPEYDTSIIYCPYIPLSMTKHYCIDGGECEFNEDIQLLTYPPQVRCTKCNKTKFIGTSL